MSSRWINSKYKVVLSYVANTTGGDIKKGQEDDEWPDNDPTYTTFEPLGIGKSNTSTRAPETVDVEFNPDEFVGKPVHMVVVRYTDGDTFGESKGCWYVEGIYTDGNEALLNKSNIFSDKYTKESFLPWKGYFCSLEKVEIHTFVLTG